MFIDTAVITVQSGKGGNGLSHFRREKFVPRGGPDGGDGGRGGDVRIIVDNHLNTLSKFRSKNRFSAEGGGNGGKQKMTGHSAEDVVISVPPGTMVYDDKTGELLADLVKPDQEFIAVKGGRGGRGNVHFASSVRQTPEMAEKGEPGETKELRLELKLIADAGIVGKPNAGKSTLLAAVTNAKPKIASYPFTTLEPNLGVARLDNENELVLADIPGIIEGAHSGAGLGDRFLKHIQRTKVLIHVVDGSAENPALDFIQINSELALYDDQLSRKPQIVAFNKIDIPGVLNRWERISNAIVNAALEKQIILDKEKDLFAISGLSRTNLRPVLYRALNLLDNLTESTSFEEIPVYRLESDPKSYTIIRTSLGWRVKGEAIERGAAMTYWDNFESVQHFQRIMEKLGIYSELLELGIEEGESVFIGEHELEWRD